MVKNFEIRQTARDEEVEALRQAKAILSGAKFEAFLQGAWSHWLWKLLAEENELYHAHCITIVG